MAGFNPHKLLKCLSAGERGELMHALMSGRAISGDTVREPVSPAALLGVEYWFWNQIKTATTTKHANARLRMWFIFMFLRFGGLRLGEIFDLRDEDVDFRAGVIHVKGAHDRWIPFPLAPARRMGSAWRDWISPVALAKPLRCDASLVRRQLAKCAEDLGMAPNLLNASSLRRNRALELAAEGLHPTLIAIFLGRSNDNGIFRAEEVQNLITKYIQKETAMKTSARNVFSGKITGLREKGILVEVNLETSDGLKVTSVITNTSRKTLDLKEGKGITAIVKAPWVTVFPESERARCGLDNCFQGKVENVKRDELACEILVVLPQGNGVCALYANGAQPEECIQEGAEVVATFSPFAVILTENCTP